jgi:uncharacterized protein YciI
LPQADFELDQVTVVLLLEGPRRQDYGRQETQRLLNAHLEYTVDLVRSGYLLHAGALVDTEAEHGKLTGVSFSRLSAAELEPLIGDDPAVIAGIESFRVLTHIFPKGSISFRQEAKDESERVAVER